MLLGLGMCYLGRSLSRQQSFSQSQSIQYSIWVCGLYLRLSIYLHRPPPEIYENLLAEARATSEIGGLAFLRRHHCTVLGLWVCYLAETGS
jgi:hypothetical protein